MYENYFNLNEAIDRWRSGLYQTDQFTSEQLDELEPVESDQEAIRPIDELFFWPLAISFLLVLAAVMFAMLPGMRRAVAPV